MENNPALRILPRCSAFLTALALCLACLLWPGAAWSASPQGALDNYEQRRRNVASLLEAATVFVFSRTDDTIHFGSGFFVADGYVLTNAHVVEDAEPDEIYIANDALPPVKASIVSISHQSGSSEDSLPKRDFALLRYSHPTSGKRPFLSFNLDVRRMDRVSAWGFPGMVTQFDQRMQAILEDKVSARDFAPPPVVYTEGTVSALVKSGGEAVIHTAAIAGGNSGGPLVNRKGEVVGVNTWGYKEEEEGAFINAALPAHTAIAFLQENGIQPTLAADNAASPPSAPALAPAETTPGRSQTPPARNRPKRPGAGGETASSPQDAGEDSRLTNGDALALLKQARSGDVDAIAAVGACYLEEEEGFPRDYVQARLWLEKSAAAGNALGQGLLGFLYLGLYDPDLHEPEKALELLKTSASAPEPDPDIQALLAELLYNGQYLGIPFDPEESLRLAQEAAESDVSTALALIGLHYHEGYAVRPDREKAAEFLAKALRANPEEPLALGLQASLAYFDDQADAVELAGRAARSDDSLGMGVLALLYAFEEEHRDDVQAERWARRSAGQAGYYGLYVLGRFYLEGRVVNTNIPLAWAYLSLANERFDDAEFEGGPWLSRAASLLSAKEKKQALLLRADLLADWGLTSY